MQDQDNKYEASDDEYQFDEDMSYEDVEDAGSSSVPPIETESTGGGLSRSKRMGIGLVAFLGLVFVMYKMVSPGTSTPATDIIPQSPMLTEQQAQPAIQAPQQVAAQQPMQQQMAQQQPMQQQPMQQQPVAQQQPMQQQQMAQPAAGQQQTATAQQQINQMMGQQQLPQQLSAQAQAQVASAQQQFQQGQQQQLQNQPAVQQQLAQQQQQAASVMQQMMGSVQQQAQQPQQSRPPMPQQVGTAQQPEYQQLIRNYESQNKALEAQVDVLNKRVASMELEMNQLIRTLTEHYDGASAVTTSPGAVQSQQEMAPPPPPKIPYSVQAIIPGRAWLRSNSGDTVTVTEGDEIKGVGRVIKIDPYDGIVQIDVRGQAISLSYGAGN